MNKTIEFGRTPRSCWEFFNTLEEADYPQQIIDAFMNVPRNLFMPGGVPDEYVYSSGPWSLSDEMQNVSSISQPEIVARMTRELQIEAGQKALEVGVGTGFQSAILSYIVGENGNVYGIDIDEDIVRFAKHNLNQLQINNVQLVEADGSIGLEEFAPFDRILVTASMPPLPINLNPLCKQLADGGILVAPIGGFGHPSSCFMMQLRNMGEDAFHVDLNREWSCVFVPLEGENGWTSFHSMITLGALDHFIDNNTELTLSDFLSVQEKE